MIFKGGLLLNENFYRSLLLPKILANYYKFSIVLFLFLTLFNKTMVIFIVWADAK